MIEAVSLKRQMACYAPEYEEAVLRVLHSGWYVLGRELEAFEAEFARYLGVKHCIGVGNGQEALILAFRALGIGPGDEVIVPANTYIASVLGITENGATPVFVEPDEYFNLDVTRIEAAITPRTKAILPVHLYGQSCDAGGCATLRKDTVWRSWRTAPSATGPALVDACAAASGPLAASAFTPPSRWEPLVTAAHW